jgi:hypothetical protein
LIDSESPRRFIHQLHRDPKKTIHCLLGRYVERQSELERIPQLANLPPSICNT